METVFDILVVTLNLAEAKIYPNIQEGVSDSKNQNRIDRSRLSCFRLQKYNDKWTIGKLLFDSPEIPAKVAKKQRSKYINECWEEEADAKFTSR